MEVPVTRDEVIKELQEVEKDLLAFKKSRDCLTLRLFEMEGQPERLAMMVDWPGYKVVENGLIMAIVRCEGLIEDYQKMLGLPEVPGDDEV